MPADLHDAPEGVGFLTACLVRHPQVGSARLNQGQLRLDFYIHRRIRKKELEAFRERLLLSWNVFFQLQRMAPGQIELVMGQSPPRGLAFLSSAEDDEPPEVETLSIIRDVPTLSVEELSLLVELVREQFDDGLAYEEARAEEDGQEEMLHRSLERLRAHSSDFPLTGFRDEQRVLIYPSADGGLGDG